MSKHYTIQNWLKNYHPDVFLEWVALQKKERTVRSRERYRVMAAALAKTAKPKTVHK